MKVNFPDFAKANVLVLGDVMLDRYWSGDTDRISPEAPVPVVRVNDIHDRPGGAGNVALNIAALGGHIHLVGVCGKDKNAEILKDKLTAANVLHSLKQLVDIPTITKLRVLSRHQQLIRLDFEEVTELNVHDFIISTFEKVAIDCQAVILSDYGKGTLENPQVIITAAKKRKLPVLVDPKGHDFARYRGASVLTPNYGEFIQVVGECASENDIITKANNALLKYDIDAILVTRGEKGMTLIQQGHDVLHLPAQAKEVFDVTGAGDTVIAVLAATIAAGNDIAEATILANYAASISVGKLGAATVTGPELRRALQQDSHYRQHSGYDSGIMNLEQIKQACEDAKAHKERIVFTNGCFDILHAGHAHYLKQAKELGDRLIIAVNDDASVAKLKGAGRPINQLAQRMAVLAAMNAVDWVVPFSEDTPMNLIQALNPDVLVKGGDYDIEGVVGHEHVLAMGGDVKILDFVAGCSTTSVVERVKEIHETEEVS